MARLFQHQLKYIQVTMIYGHPEEHGSVGVALDNDGQPREVLLRTVDCLRMANVAGLRYMFAIEPWLTGRSHGHNCG